MFRFILLTAATVGVGVLFLVSAITAPSASAITPAEGDIDQNGIVNSSDLLLVALRAAGTDVNHDGRTNSRDLRLVAQVFGSVPPPPPATETESDRPDESDASPTPTATTEAVSTPTEAPPATAPALPTDTATPAAAATAAATATATSRVTTTVTQTRAATNTPTPTPADTATATATVAPTSTPTPTPTPTSTNTALRTPTSANTPTPTPTGLVASQSGTLDTLDTVITDMQGNHEGCLPAGVDGVKNYAWQFHPITNSVAPPAGFVATTGWAALEADCNGNPATNVRAEFRGFKTYLLLKSTGRWTLVQSSTGIGGGQFLPNFTQNVNEPADIRNEGGGMTSVAPVAGRAFHFWHSPDGRVSINDADVAAIFVTLQARLIVDDPTSADDLDTAKLLLAAGGDWWHDLSAPWPNNAQAGFAKFKWLRRDWRPFNLTTASETTLRANPPPLD